MESLTRERVTRLREQHRTITEPCTFRLCGSTWDLLPGVYAPNLTPSAALYAEWIPYPVDGSFCEIGCGTGYLSVIAARRGCAQVTALDIAPAAVENTRLNAERHGVSDRVSALCGDMFAPLPAGSRHDVIFWNSNFAAFPLHGRNAVDGVPEDGSAISAQEREELLDRAFCDPGYATHRAFFRDVGAHLAPGGRALLGFTGLGDAALLGRVAGEYGWRVAPCRRAVGGYPDGELVYELLELRRA